MIGRLTIHLCMRQTPAQQPETATHVHRHMHGLHDDLLPGRAQQVSNACARFYCGTASSNAFLSRGNAGGIASLSLPCTTPATGRANASSTGAWHVHHAEHTVLL